MFIVKYLISHNQFNLMKIEKKKNYIIIEIVFNNGKDINYIYIYIIFNLN